MIHHHVGCAVKDIAATRDKLVKMLKAEATEIIFDPLQNAELCMLRLPDGSQIELISGEVVKGFVKKQVTYYHVCYAVEDIEDAISSLQSDGAVLISPPKPAILFDGQLVAFLITPIGLMELVETKASQ